MTYEGLLEMFEGDSADMCAGKFPLVSMGNERGPPLALAEISFLLLLGGTVIQNPRRGCCRVPKLRMGS